MAGRTINIFAMNNYPTFSQQPNPANNKLYEKMYDDASHEFSHGTNFKHLKVIKPSVNINYANFPPIDIFTYGYKSSPPKKSLLSLDPSLPKLQTLGSVCQMFLEMGIFTLHPSQKTMFLFGVRAVMALQ